MASPSSPFSPQQDSADPDVNDPAVFQDLPQGRRHSHEGITLFDLVEAEERFGAHFEEGQEVVVPKGTEENVVGGGLRAMTDGNRLLGLGGVAGHPTASSSRASDDVGVDSEEMARQGRRTLPLAPRPRTEDRAVEARSTISKAMKSAETVQYTSEILDSLREIAVSPPPYAFPSTSFAIQWPLPMKYAAHNNLSPLHPDYWTYTQAHHLGDYDIMTRLEAVCSAGWSFCTHAIGEQADRGVKGDLLNLSKLAETIFETYELCSVLTRQKSNNVEFTNKLMSWIADKMTFVLHHMQAAIEGDGAYQASPLIKLPETNIHEARRVRDRFTALVERVVHWDKHINTTVNFTGMLVKNFDKQATKILKVVLHQGKQKEGKSKIKGFHAGHTKYEIKSTGDIPGAEFDRNMLALLPNVRVELSVNVQPGEGDGTLKKAAGMLPRTDTTASAKHNKRLHTFTRGLVQQYIALRALLSTCHLKSLSKCWPNLLNIVQLDQSHSNLRSIMIFKSAWLVIMQADKLWDVLRKHEEKGRLGRSWIDGDKVRLKECLEKMTKMAVFTQIDAAREALRYEELQGQGKKYWGFEGEGVDVEMG